MSPGNRPSGRLVLPMSQNTPPTTVTISPATIIHFPMLEKSMAILRQLPPGRQKAPVSVPEAQGQTDDGHRHCHAKGAIHIHQETQRRFSIILGLFAKNDRRQDLPRKTQLGASQEGKSQAGEEQARIARPPSQDAYQAKPDEAEAGDQAIRQRKTSNQIENDLIHRMVSHYQRSFGCSGPVYGKPR